MIGSVPSEHTRTAHTILQNLFILNKSRGEHASGFSALHTRPGGRLITEKRSISPIKLVERSARFKAFAKDMPNIFIGHTRFATSGTPKRGRNNHPFNSGRYSMVHNGGIDRWQSIAHQNKLNLRSETDSEVILRLAERKDNFHDGISHAMEIAGYGSRVAVAFLQHTGEPRLFLFRNLANSVYVMTYPRLHAMFFSSEGNHLKTAVRGVYGKKTDEIMKEHEVDVEILPDWKSLEFMLDSDGLPDIIEELEVKRLTRPMGFTSSTSVTRGCSTVEVDNSDCQSSLPIVAGTGKTKYLPALINDYSTGQLLEISSEETREQSVKLCMAAREAAEVVTCINKHRFMQYKEIEHFKKWMKDV